MNKAGLVYREIAETALGDSRAKLVGREIARKLGVSPDTVSNAIAPLKRIGAVSVYKRHFAVSSLKKVLLYWAVNRKLDRDIVYGTYVKAKEPAEIENRMPNEVAFTEFSGYCKSFPEEAAPADYSEVYVYAGEKALGEIKRRFPTGEHPPLKGTYRNLIVMKPDKILGSKIDGRTVDRSSVSVPQLYVDLWNNDTWMAYEFLKRLEEKIGKRYGKAVLE